MMREINFFNHFFMTVMRSPQQTRALVRQRLQFMTILIHIYSILVPHQFMKYNFWNQRWKNRWTRQNRKHITAYIMSIWYRYVRSTCRFTQQSTILCLSNDIDVTLYIFQVGETIKVWFLCYIFQQHEKPSHLFLHKQLSYIW